MQMLYRLSYVGWSFWVFREGDTEGVDPSCCRDAAPETETWLSVWRRKTHSPDATSSPESRSGLNASTEMYCGGSGLSTENRARVDFSARTRSRRGSEAGHCFDPEGVPRIRKKVERETGLEPATSSLEG